MDCEDSQRIPAHTDKDNNRECLNALNHILGQFCPVFGSWFKGSIKLAPFFSCRVSFALLRQGSRAVCLPICSPASQPQQAPMVLQASINHVIQQHTPIRISYRLCVGSIEQRCRQCSCGTALQALLHRWERRAALKNGMRISSVSSSRRALCCSIRGNEREVFLSLCFGELGAQTGTEINIAASA